MTSRVERRYRALLKVLPHWYRAEREEEMVASFLDGRPDDDLDPEYGWPGWAEAGATLALALRTRMDRPIGEAVRLLGMFGLVLGVAIATPSLVYFPDHEPLQLLAHICSVAALIAATRAAVTATRVLAAVPLAVGAIPVVTSSHPVEFLFAVAFLLPAATSLLALCATEPKADNRWLWAAAAAAVVPFTGLIPTLVAPVALLAVALIAHGREWMIAVALASCVLLPYTVLTAPIAGWPVIALGAALMVVALRVSRALPIPLRD